MKTEIMTEGGACPGQDVFLCGAPSSGAPAPVLKAIHAVFLVSAWPGLCHLAKHIRLSPRSSACVFSGVLFGVPSGVSTEAPPGIREHWSVRLKPSRVFLKEPTQPPPFLPQPNGA